ncbi:MAG TPA: GNAT family N-acetyltransferase [Acidimicrobiales bacterium]|nr:GNAT family N-acetyltransferase [Acidimicrobiales bacterium]
MTDLEVRTASVDDVPGVEPLVADSLSQLATLRGGIALLEMIGMPPGAGPEEVSSALCGQALLGTTTLVATLSGSVVGVAVVVRTEAGLDLIGIHTARSMRRRRIGTTLLDATRAIASELGVRFEALALPGDQTVKSLLEAGGFKARLLRMAADR